MTACACVRYVEERASIRRLQRRVSEGDEVDGMMSGGIYVGNRTKNQASIGIGVMSVTQTHRHEAEKDTRQTLSPQTHTYFPITPLSLQLSSDTITADGSTASPRMSYPAWKL